MSWESEGESVRRESLENLWRWGFRLWKWLGIEVRISLLLVIWMVMDGLYFLREYHGLSWSSAFLYWGMSSLFLFTIVLLHEYGHCFAGRAVGGSAERIVLWPLGGLALVDAPHSPRPQFIVAAGGPAVNVAIFLIMLPYIIWGGGDFSSYFLRAGLDPSLPQVHWFASMFFAINLDLFIFNLLPAYPMDGGRMLHTRSSPVRLKTTASPRAEQVQHAPSLLRSQRTAEPAGRTASGTNIRAQSGFRK